MIAPIVLSALVLLAVSPTSTADPEIDRLLRSPVGKDWVTNGGNLANQRCSTLKQIDATNVGQRLP
jgi:quinohemoprotein ethanol dehydrogenase